MRDALRRFPGQIGARVVLTRWFLEVGRHAEAVRTIRPAAQVLPDDPDIAELLAQAESDLADELAHRRPPERFAPDLALPEAGDTGWP